MREKEELCSIETIIRKIIHETIQVIYGAIFPLENFLRGVASITWCAAFQSSMTAELTNFRRLFSEHVKSNAIHTDAAKTNGGDIL